MSSKDVGERLSATIKYERFNSHPIIKNRKEFNKNEDKFHRDNEDVSIFVTATFPSN